MAKPDNWVHSNLNILNINRTAHLEPELAEGDEREPEEVKKLIEAADPYEPRLKPITNDK
jgi:radial spoke head protein 4A